MSTNPVEAQPEEPEPQPEAAPQPETEQPKPKSLIEVLEQCETLLSALPREARGSSGEMCCGIVTARLRELKAQRSAMQAALSTVESILRTAHEREFGKLA
jgi:pyridoxal/pyridoxine/pyridoxamine kinase